MWHSSESTLSDLCELAFRVGGPPDFSIERDWVGNWFDSEFLQRVCGEQLADLDASIPDRFGRRTVVVNSFCGSTGLQLRMK